MNRLIVLGISCAVASGILFVNLYTSIVDAPNWGADLPNSIVNARAYYSATNPGTFFRMISPINQVLALTAVFLCWRINRYIALASLAVAVLLDVFTFGYFYPRNEILFAAPLQAEAIQQAWREWSSMNWFRSGLGVINVALTFMLLVSVSKRQSQ